MATEAMNKKEKQFIKLNLLIFAKVLFILVLSVASEYESWDLYSNTG